MLCRVCVCVFCAWRGFVYSKAQENLRASPPREGGGGGLIIEAIRIAFVVHAAPSAVEAAGADHEILAAQAFEGVARRRTRCCSCYRAACN